MVDTEITFTADVEKAKESMQELRKEIERLNAALDEIETPPASMEIHSVGAQSFATVNWNDSTSTGFDIEVTE